MQDQDFKKKLTKEQYQVMRLKGTEAPFAGKYLRHNEEGSYKCAACGQELFSNKTKFDSGSGWPSFYDVAKRGSVKLVEDNSLGLQRIEVVCSKCGSHLGHVFNDASDQPTGQRYCINSCALDFKPKK